MFRLTLAESASHLKSLYDKLGKKVDQARPYYETSNQTEHVRPLQKSPYLHFCILGILKSVFDHRCTMKVNKQRLVMKEHVIIIMQPEIW